MSTKHAKKAKHEEDAEFVPETVNAVCEAIAPMKDRNRKIGEEIRFYVDGQCVRTHHEYDPVRFGNYEIGKTYEITTAEAPTENHPKPIEASGE